MHIQLYQVIAWVGFGAMFAILLAGGMNATKGRNMGHYVRLNRYNGKTKYIKA